MYKLVQSQCDLMRIRMKSSDAKASKCHLKFSALMMIFLPNLYI